MDCLDAAAIIVEGSVKIGKLIAALNSGQPGTDSILADDQVRLGYIADLHQADLRALTTMIPKRCIDVEILAAFAHQPADLQAALVATLCEIELAAIFQRSQNMLELTDYGHVPLAEAEVLGLRRASMTELR